MGYTSVANRSDAVVAAAELAGESSDVSGDEISTFLARYPLLVEQVVAEAGVVEPVLCARALRQAQGDLVRAVSLVRAWAATLPRLHEACVAASELRALRRITPGFSQPPGGQYLGASLDYAQRLLQLGALPPRTTPNGKPVSPADLEETVLSEFPGTIGPLQDEGLIEIERSAEPRDITRVKRADAGRGALLQFLARGETGAMTALAYTAIRGYGHRQDPTLIDFRSGMLPIRMQRPGGGEFTIGEVPATFADVVLYRMHDDGGADARLTLGFGATPGRVERRAIAAAMLDAGCARASQDPDGERNPCDDEEFITIALDGQEASGFVEHLKLPHYVTFTSDLDRVRASRANAGAEEPA